MGRLAAAFYEREARDQQYGRDGVESRVNVGQEMNHSVLKRLSRDVPPRANRSLAWVAERHSLCCAVKPSAAIFGGYFSAISSSISLSISISWLGSRQLNLLRTFPQRSTTAKSVA